MAANKSVRRAVASTAILAAGALAIHAQQDPGAPRNFIKIDAPVIALEHARVIDGTGAAARLDQTIVIRGGSISEIGDSSRVTPPSGATTVDLTGRSVIPGLVMMHEHLFYPVLPFHPASMCSRRSFATISCAHATVSRRAASRSTAISCPRA